MLDLLKCANWKIVNGLIGIEGVPYAGKTSLAKSLGQKYQRQVVSDHTDFSWKLRAQAQQPWPYNDVNGILRRQNEFLTVERDRDSEALKHIAKDGAVLLDRTIFSILAYTAARLTHERKTIVERTITGLVDALCSGTVNNHWLLPETIVWLRIPERDWIRRVKNAKLEGNRKGTEEFLFLSRTFRRLDNFYNNIFASIAGIHVIECAGTLRRNARIHNILSTCLSDTYLSKAGIKYN